MIYLESLQSLGGLSIVFITPKVLRIYTAVRHEVAYINVRPEKRT